jgi:hypothetical protein
MMLSLVISAISVIPWTLAFMFSTNDLEAVGSSRFPILEVYQQALNNRSGATFLAVYGAIYVGSTTAFNSFISMSILSLNVTYAIPQGIVFFRGRDKILPSTRHFNLGKVLGPFCNIFCVLWVSLYTVLFCLPTFLPAEVASMNYVSVVVAGVVLIITIMWFSGKNKTFSGPVSYLTLNNPLLLRRERVVLMPFDPDHKHGAPRGSPGPAR